MRLREKPQAVEAHEAQYGYHVSVVERDDGLVAHAILAHGKECGVVFHVLHHGLFPRLKGHDVVFLEIGNGHAKASLHAPLVVGTRIVAEEVAGALDRHQVVQFEEALEVMVAHILVAGRVGIIHLVALLPQQSVRGMLGEEPLRLRPSSTGTMALPSE